LPPDLIAIPANTENPPLYGGFLLEDFATAKLPQNKRGRNFLPLRFSSHQLRKQWRP
jgi:hypothetical protein